MIAEHEMHNSGAVNTLWTGVELCAQRAPDGNVEFWSRSSKNIARKLYFTIEFTIN